MRTPIKEKDLIEGQIVYDTGHENGIPLKFIGIDNKRTMFDTLGSTVYGGPIATFPSGSNETWYLPNEDEL